MPSTSLKNAVYNKHDVSYLKHRFKTDNVGTNMVSGMILLRSHPMNGNYGD